MLVFDSREKQSLTIFSKSIIQGQMHGFYEAFQNLQAFSVAEIFEDGFGNIVFVVSIVGAFWLHDVAILARMSFL